MSYYIKAEEVSLDDLRRRIEDTDLVPSRISLMDDIAARFRKLKEHGLLTLADLRKELKNTKNIPSLSDKTGIDRDYLTLLRREVEGYFPRAFPLSSFEWLDKEDKAKLEFNGFYNTAMLFEALHSTKKRAELINLLGLDPQFIDFLFALTDLTRIQWVSPTVARMLFSAGYIGAKMVSKADAEILCDELDRVNKENNYFKGKIGLRDIKRLVKAASYIP